MFHGLSASEKSGLISAAGFGLSRTAEAHDSDDDKVLRRCNERPDDAKVLWWCRGRGFWSCDASRLLIEAAGSCMLRVKPGSQLLLVVVLMELLGIHIRYLNCRA
jgi:hypothetical protein